MHHLDLPRIVDTFEWRHNALGKLSAYLRMKNVEDVHTGAPPIAIIYLLVQPRVVRSPTQTSTNTFGWDAVQGEALAHPRREEDPNIIFAHIRFARFSQARFGRYSRWRRYKRMLPVGIISV